MYVLNTVRTYNHSSHPERGRMEHLSILSREAICAWSTDDPRRLDHNQVVVGQRTRKVQAFHSRYKQPSDSVITIFNGTYHKLLVLSNRCSPETATSKSEVRNVRTIRSALRISSSMVNTLSIIVLIFHLMQILSRIDALICLHYRWQCEDYRKGCGWIICVRNYIRIVFNWCTAILEGVILFNDNNQYSIYNTVCLREYHE